MKRRSFSPRRTCLAIFAILLSFAGLGWAERPPLVADVQPLAPRARSGAPIWIDVHLSWSRQSLVEGELELEVSAGGDPLFRQVIGDLALIPGKTSRRLLLPPIGAGRNDLETHLRFKTRDQTFDLGHFPVSTNNYAFRQYLIAVCSKSGGRSVAASRLWQAMRPDRQMTASPSATRTIASYPVVFAPDELPSAIGLCAFDLVTIDGPALVALSDRQRQELVAWLQGGGSLCVSTGGEPAGAVLPLLRELAGGPDTLSDLQADARDQFSGASGSMRLLRAGLGRMVVLLQPPTTESEVDAEVWKRPARFLARSEAGPSADGRRPSDDERRGRFSAVQRALNEVRPQTSRIVPLPVIAGVLGVFVLLVGPGEWWVLGFLRRRRWTWMTFPILALGCTWFMVWTAENYLGRDTQQATFIITDIGKGGRILRQNRFQVTTAGRRMQSTSDLQEAIAVPFFLGNSDPSDRADARPVYRGNLTGHFLFSQTLEQWQPRYTRSLQFVRPVPVPVLQWDALDPQVIARRTDLLHYSKNALQAGAWSVDVAHLGQVISSRYSLHVLSHDTDSLAGMAGVASTGGADFRDLAVHDRTDPHEYLVTATQKIGNEFHILRRLYHTDE